MFAAPLISMPTFDVGLCIAFAICEWVMPASVAGSYCTPNSYFPPTSMNGKLPRLSVSFSHSALSEELRASSGR